MAEPIIIQRVFFIKGCIQAAFELKNAGHLTTIRQLSLKQKSQDPADDVLATQTGVVTRKPCVLLKTLGVRAIASKKHLCSQSL